jgi:hypothetical protein
VCPAHEIEELVYACEHKREKDVQRLLREGRNPNAKGKGQQRPLQLGLKEAQTLPR